MVLWEKNLEEDITADIKRIIKDFHEQLLL